MGTEVDIKVYVTPGFARWVGSPDEVLLRTRRRIGLEPVPALPIFLPSCRRNGH